MFSSESKKDPHCKVICFAIFEPMLIKCIKPFSYFIFLIVFIHIFLMLKFLIKMFGFTLDKSNKNTYNAFSVTD